MSSASLLFSYSSSVLDFEEEEDREIDYFFPYFF